MHLSLRLLLWLVLLQLMAKNSLAQQPNSLNVGVSTSIRALQVVNDSVLWFGGNKGWLGRSTDGGRTWKRWQPAGEQADFRTLHAIDVLNAIAATTTRPANVLRTHDGGKTWKRVFQSRDTSVFLDGMAFWNANEGVLFGDPIDNRLFLMRTNDSGHHWTPFHPVEQPLFAPGEACFAASGTGILAVGDSTLLILSGGSVSRLWYSYDRGHSWQHTPTPLLQGQASQGGFGMGISPDSQLVIVGGDYLKIQDTIGHIALYSDNFWWKSRTTTRGYREAVIAIDTLIWLATGPSGSDISYNGGLDWHPFNLFQGMHTVRKAGIGKAVYLAGNGGVIWKYSQINLPQIADWQPKFRYSKALQVGDLKRLERQIQCIVRKHGQNKQPSAEEGYKMAAAKVAAEIRQLEGVDSVFVAEDARYAYFIDGIRVRQPVILHTRLRKGMYGANYCIELDKGTYRLPRMKRWFTSKHRLANPRIYPCPDFEKEQYINRQRWRE